MVGSIYLRCGVGAKVNADRVIDQYRDICQRVACAVGDATTRATANVADANARDERIVGVEEAAAVLRGIDRVICGGEVARTGPAGDVGKTSFVYGNR